MLFVRSAHNLRHPGHVRLVRGPEPRSACGCDCGNASTTARDIQLARDGGFHWVKQRFEWRNIEGKAKGEFEWNEPDRILDAISQAGLKVVARVDNQPKWASSSIQWPGSGPPDNPTDWTDFLTALATRYKGRIQAYEIWNEPNLDREWGDKQPDPAAYTAMLKASYAGIKAADPQALVVLPYLD